MARGAGPRCRDHEALVRPIVASRCDGDCLFLFHDYSRVLQLGAALHVINPEVRELGDRPFAGPFAYGHECVAEVVDVGDAVRGVAVGQRVIVPWAISCGAVRRAAGTDLAVRAQGDAARGLRLRRALRRLGRHGQRRAARAVRRRHARARARGRPADARRGQRQPARRLADRRPAPPRRAGRPGPRRRRCGTRIGLYAAGIAVALGSSRVDYVDGDPGSLAIAGGWAPTRSRSPAGPLVARRPAPLASRYPITVDASNREAGLEFAIRALAPGGVCTAVGFYFRSGTPLPLWHMYLKGARLHVGVSNPGPTCRPSSSSIASGRFDPTR